LQLFPVLRIYLFTIKNIALRILNRKAKHTNFLERYREIADSLYVYAQTLTKNQDNAEDLVSDTKLLVTKNLMNSTIYRLSCEKVL